MKRKRGRPKAKIKKKTYCFYLRVDSMDNLQKLCELNKTKINRVFENYLEAFKDNE